MVKNITLNVITVDTKNKKLQQKARTVIHRLKLKVQKQEDKEKALYQKYLDSCSVIHETIKNLESEAFDKILEIYNIPPIKIGDIVCKKEEIGKDYTFHKIVGYGLEVSNYIPIIRMRKFSLKDKDKKIWYMTSTTTTLDIFQMKELLIYEENLIPRSLKLQFGNENNIRMD